MPRILKWLLAAAGILVTVLIAAVAAVVLFFDPNDYRDEIAAGLSDKLGREVTLDGPLTLSLFPWLAIESGGLQVADAPGFADTPMLRVERARAAVQLLPLLSGSLRVGRVTVSGVTLNLAVAADGRNNWSDLVADDAAAPAADDEASAPIDLSIEGVTVDNATLTYADRQAGSRYRLEQFAAEIDGVDLAAPIPVRLGFDLAAAPAGASGRVDLQATLRWTAAEKRLDVTALDLDGDINADALAASQPLRLTADSLSLNTGTMALSLPQGEFELGVLSVAINANGTASPMALEGRVDIASFAPRAAMDMLAQPAPVTADPDALATAKAGADFTLAADELTLTKLALDVDDTALNGRLTIRDFANPAFVFDLKGTRINLDRYLPPANEQAADDAGDNLGETALPVDLIRGLRADGAFTMEQVVLGELPFDGLTLGLKAGNDQVRLNPVRGTVLGGSYSGDVRIDARGQRPSLALNETVRDVDLGQLARLLWERDNVAGTLAGQFNLKGSGTTLADIRASLNGKVEFSLTDGALTGTDVWYQIRRARALFKKQTPPPAPSPARTEFSTISGTANVADGVARNDDLFAELPFLQLTGKGRVNLADATVDYGLQARVLERPEFLAGATAAELDEYTEAVIPLRITGPLASPTVKPDFAGVVRNVIEDKIESEKDRLRRRLLERLGGDKEGEDEEPLDPEEELKKRLKDIF